MNLALIKKWITRWESTRFAAYDDKTGKPITPTTVLFGKAHIGVGFDLEAPGAQAIVIGLHLDYAGIKAGRVIITADQVDELLDATVALAVTGARNLVPTLDALPADKQLVLVDLVFNMGEHGLSKFVNTLQAVKDSSGRPLRPPFKIRPGSARSVLFPPNAAAQMWLSSPALQPPPASWPKGESNEHL